MNVQLQAADGPVSGTILGEFNYKGKQMLIVDIGAGAFVKGVYSKFVVVNPSQILDRKVQNEEI